MTRIRIQDTEYDLVGSVNDAALGDLLVLKTKTKTDSFPGVSVKTIAETFQEIGRLSQLPDFKPIDLLDNEALLQNLIGCVWLARRKAGEQLRVEEAGRVSFNDIEILDDEDDEENDGIPKEGSAGEGSEPTT